MRQLIKDTHPLAWFIAIFMIIDSSLCNLPQQTFGAVLMAGMIAAMIYLIVQRVTE